MKILKKIEIIYKIHSIYKNEKLKKSLLFQELQKLQLDF